MPPKGPSENPHDKPIERKPEADALAARKALKAKIAGNPTEGDIKKELTPEQEARLAEAVNAYLAVEEQTRRQLQGALPEAADEGARTA